MGLAMGNHGPFSSMIYLLNIYGETWRFSIAKCELTRVWKWLVVWNMFYFSIYWEFHHPNWQTHIFQDGWNHQPGNMRNWYETETDCLILFYGIVPGDMLPKGIMRIHNPFDHLFGTIISSAVFFLTVCVGPGVFWVPNKFMNPSLKSGLRTPNLNHQ